MIDSPNSQTNNHAQRFLDLARLGRGGWRYAVTVGLTLFTFLLLSLVFGVVLVISTGGSADLSQVPPNLMLVAATLPFVGLLLALWVGVRFVHGRPFRSLITPLARLRWDRLLIAGAIWFGLAALGDLLLAAFVFPGTYVFQFDAARLLPYTVLVLLLIPLQATTEELFFRGYLMQGFGQISRGQVLLPLVITSVIFGLMHALNTEISTYGLGVMMAFYIGFGLLLGWLTLSTGSLEPAIGLHVANNIYSTLIVTFPGSSLPAPALFRITQYDPVMALVVSLISAMVVLLAFRALGYTRPAPPEAVEEAPAL